MDDDLNSYFASRPDARANQPRRTPLPPEAEMAPAEA